MLFKSCTSQRWFSGFSACKSPLISCLCCTWRVQWKSNEIFIHRIILSLCSRQFLFRCSFFFALRASSSRYAIPGPLVVQNIKIEPLQGHNSIIIADNSQAKRLTERKTKSYRHFFYIRCSFEDDHRNRKSRSHMDKNEPNEGCVGRVTPPPSHTFAQHRASKYP